MSNTYATPNTKITSLQPGDFIITRNYRQKRKIADIEIKDGIVFITIDNGEQLKYSTDQELAKLPVVTIEELAGE